MNAGRTLGWGRFSYVVGLIVLVVALATSACSGSDPDTSDTTQPSAGTVSTTAGLPTTSSESTSTTSPADAALDSSSKAPDRSKLITTVAWGEVPANQIGVVFEDGAPPIDAEALATALGGAVVGEVPLINAYLIETAGSTQTDLVAALEAARATPGVTQAFPNLQTEGATEIWGVRQTPLNDPAYGAGRDQGFQLIGAQKAWSYMRGSGLPYSDVHVGIVDDGLYRGTNEFDGDSSIYFPDSDAGELSDPQKDTNENNGVTVDKPTGSHGTMVAGIVGADPSNGGNTGLASPVLGNHLTISMVNHNDGSYGNKEVSNPDPNDPAIVRWSDGKSYSFGSLAAITKEVQAGARVINCSWGTNMKPLLKQLDRMKNGEITPEEYQVTVASYKQTAAAYKSFFEKMSAEHPDVLFVCSAGNDGWVMPGSVRWPSGLSLPNMITVGNVMNDGSTADSSNRINTKPGQEFEVTLAAPGQQVVQGLDADGNAVTNETDIGNGHRYGGGTSAATPQVTAAAALLLALDPDLTAGEIKQLLTETARPGPPELGGGILAIDQAVLKVINMEREQRGLPPVSGDDLENAAVIDAVAISQDDPNTWTVKGIVKALPSVDGAEVIIDTTTGTKIEGETSQKLTGPGEVVWEKVVVANDQALVTITRSDTGAASVIAFEEIDLNGTWEGTCTITDVVIDEEAASSEGGEGCDLEFLGAILDKLKGVPLPMVMEITADAEAGTGEAVTTIDASGVDMGEDVTIEPPEPTTIPFTFVGGEITFQPESSGGEIGSMKGTVMRQGDDLVMKGVLASSGPGFSVTMVFTLTQQ